MAAEDTNSTAVASAERSAAFVSFQRQRGSFPPVKNINAAVSHLLAADNSAGKLQLMQQLQHLLQFKHLHNRVETIFR